jgi:hypothetical protein
MPNLTITPQSALLTVGQPVTFVATLDGQPAPDAIWTLSPSTMGTLVSGSAAATAAGTTAPPQGGPSVTYVAPPTIAAPQSVAIVATSGTATASATVALTPYSIAVIPDAASLVANESQRFVAVIASAEPENVTWILTPPLGELTRDDQTGEGVYKAPDPVPDNCTVKVIAADRFGRQATATVTLATKPWSGFGVYLLGIYLFCIFSLVVFLIGLVPARVSNIQELKTDYAQADAALQKLRADAAGRSASDGNNSQSNNSTQKAPAPKTAANNPKPGSETAAAGGDAGSAAPSQNLQAQIAAAAKDVTEKKNAVDDATGIAVETILLHRKLNREVDLLLLVILSGALGSFLHMAQSFSDFAGNRTLKSSWVWWYALRPFVGAGLALVIYEALRGGLISVGATPGFDANGMNPYGLMAGGALAGLFSKDATQKLGEVFSTIFQTGKANQTKDKLLPQQTPAPAPKTTADAGGNAPVVR